MRTEGRVSHAKSRRVKQSTFRSWVGMFCVAASICDGNCLRADDDQVRLFPIGSRLTSPATVIGYVIQAPVRDDLKLSAEQQQRINQIRDEMRAAAQNIDASDARAISAENAARSETAQSALVEILTPEQCRRHLQIVLQQMLVSSGSIDELLYLEELSDVFQLDVDQGEQIDSIRADIGQTGYERMRANRVGRISMVTNADLLNRLPGMSDLIEQENQRIAAVLSASQKKRFLDALGMPLAGRLAPVVFSRPRPPRPKPVNFGVRRPPQLYFPRIQRRTTSNGPPATLGGSALSESPLNAALLALDDIREELKVAPERLQREVLLGGDTPEVLRCVKKLADWLKPAQLARLHQLVLQVACLRSGPAAVFEFREVIDVLQLAEEQRSKLAPLVERELNSSRHELVLAVEPDPVPRRVLEKGLSDRLDGLLNAEQRQRLSGMLGDPHRGSLSLAAIESALLPRMSLRARTTTELGQQPPINSLLMTMAAIHDELKLSDEQRQAIGNGRAFVQNPDKFHEILDATQRQRFQEISLQAEAQRDGPAAIFRSRIVIAELMPNEEQRRRLLELIQEDTRAYLRIPREKLAETLNDLDTATSAKLEAVLTDAQREKLARLLGEPANCLDQPPRAARFP